MPVDGRLVVNAVVGSVAPVAGSSSAYDAGVLPIRQLLPREGNESALHPVLVSDETLLSECDVKRLRRGGPGGQHRNKVETAVRLTHRPSGQIAEASEARSQLENRKVALRRLRFRLAMHVRTPPVDDPHWHEVTRDRKIAATPDARTGPQLVAHVFNVLDAVDQDDAAAAKLLEVSRSQLSRFLKADRTVLAAANQLRESAGMRPLR